MELETECQQPVLDDFQWGSTYHSGSPSQHVKQTRLLVYLIQKGLEVQFSDLQ